MEKSINKVKAIQAAVKAYKNDLEYVVNQSSTIVLVKRSVHLIVIKPVKLSSIEESVLVVHSRRAYQSGFPLTIQHFNEFADELLRSKGVNDIVGVN